MATGVALLMTVGGTGAASAARSNDNDNQKVTICHRTRSASNPWVEISVDEHAVQRHIDRHGDFVVSSTRPCPPGSTTPPPPPPPGDGDDDQDCSSENSSGNSTGNQSGLVNIGNISLDNLGSNALCQSNLLNGLTLGLLGQAFGGGGDSDADGGCSSSNDSGNSTGNQSGLVNVGNVSVNNLGSNLLCQADIANNLTAAVLGTAFGGGDDAGTDEGCTSENSSGNDTGDQYGLVNAGNVSVDNLGSNLLCQADILNNLTASVLGTSVGGGSFGSGLLTGGLGGLLSGLTTDVNVLANVLVLF